MNKAVPPSSARASQPAANQTQHRRRFGALVAALAVTGLAGCVVVPARRVAPVRVRVRV